MGWRSLTIRGSLPRSGQNQVCRRTLFLFLGLDIERVKRLFFNLPLISFNNEVIRMTLGAINFPTHILDFVSYIPIWPARWYIRVTHYFRIPIKTLSYSRLTQVFIKGVTTLQLQLNNCERTHNLKLLLEANYPCLSRSKVFVVISFDCHKFIRPGQGEERDTISPHHCVRALFSPLLARICQSNSYSDWIGVWKGILPTYRLGLPNLLSNVWWCRTTRISKL